MSHPVTSSNAAQVSGDDADVGREQTMIGENPRQHRKGGDAHRRADEQGEGQDGDAGRRQMIVHPTASAAPIRNGTTTLTPLTRAATDRFTSKCSAGSGSRRGT